MRTRLLLGAAAAVVVAGVALLTATLVDPENLGVRLVAYVVALLATIAIVLTVAFAIVAPRFGRTDVAAAELRAAQAAGRRAYARILSARPTGAQLNGAWAYDADLVVAATDRPAYRVTERIRVHRTDGRVEPGALVTVVRLRADAPGVEVVAGPASTQRDAAVSGDAAVPDDAPPWPA